MYLSRLYIENYRSIKKLDLKFEKGKNVIVGKNNSGKSNIIKAIDLILGESSPTWSKSDNIEENDFFEGKTENEIFIWCELRRDDDKDINYSLMDGAFLKVLKIYQPYRIDCNSFNKEDIFFFCTDEGSSALDEKKDNFSKKWIGTKSYCKGHDFKTEFKNIKCFAFAFRAKKIEDSIIKEMIFLYREEEQNQWMVGVTDRLRNNLLQSAIIPSFRDPKDQLRIANYTWYGKLLKKYVKKDDKDLNEAFDKVKVASKNLFEKLETELSTKKTQIAFPNTKISFQLNPDTKQDIYKSTLIYVDDGFNSKLDDKGSGIQSAITIGLFDH